MVVWLYLEFKSQAYPIEPSIIHHNLAALVWFNTIRFNHGCSQSIYK